jgi:hypothetical protein
LAHGFKTSAQGAAGAVAPDERVAVADAGQGRVLVHGILVEVDGAQCLGMAGRQTCEFAGHAWAKIASLGRGRREGLEDVVPEIFRTRSAVVVGYQVPQDAKEPGLGARRVAQLSGAGQELEVGGLKEILRGRIVVDAGANEGKEAWTIGGQAVKDGFANHRAFPGHAFR